jgi:hypothetical protein
MSKKAMKLACKALRDCHYYMINAGLPNQSLLNEAFTAYMELEAALAKQPAQQEPCGGCGGSGWVPRDPDIGTDQECFVCDGNGTVEPEQPAPVQQEPVAVVSGYYGGQCVILPIDPARIYNSNTPLYTAPQPCPTCEALARTVMLDQTSHDTLRKPLTDDEFADLWFKQSLDWMEFARAIEAAHGITGEKK